jgi:hypothetical protein
MQGYSSQKLAPVVVLLIGSLLCTGTAIIALCKLPSWASLSWKTVITLSIFYFLAAIFVQALAVRCIHKVFQDHIEVPAIDLICDTWMMAAWFPLLIILLREHSIWSTFIPPIMTAHVAMFLKNFNSSEEEQLLYPITDGQASNSFRMTQSTAHPGTTISTITSSIAFQSGLAAILLGCYMTAALLFSVGITLPLWIYQETLKPDKSCIKPRPALIAPIIYSLILIVFTGIALAPFLKDTSSLGGRDSMRGQHAANTPNRRSQGKAIGDYYSSVILFLPPTPYKKLVPPTPAIRVPASSSRAQPVVIPFDGAYWYFREPDQHPRLDAPIIHGDPTKVNIRSTDYHPLLMEAVQFLGATVKLTCCSAIQIVLRNADDRPGPIFIEMLLKSHNASGASTESLGSRVIPSSQKQHISLNRTSIDETLEFQLPSNNAGMQFDEIIVKINPAKDRDLASAHIAIQSFALVPQ